MTSEQRDEKDESLPPSESPSHAQQSPALPAVTSSQLDRVSLHRAGIIDAATLSNASDETLVEVVDHDTLKYHLLGPSLTKAGQDSVDQHKVSEIIYHASKGSKFFSNEAVKDRNLTEKIGRILTRKRQLDKLDLEAERRRADDYIAELEAGRDLSQHVVHIDCDAFYAAVEELDRPELKEVPMAVGQGVLTTCNYHARTYGCRSGMAGFVAQKLCPHLITLPLNFDKYMAKASEVRDVIRQYDPRFESASMDEAYMNITSYCAEHQQDPEDAVTQTRAEVREKCKITVSAGIAANARLAKICSNRNKPNGQFRLSNERTEIMRFMSRLPTRKVNGIGRVFERELDAIGIKTCGDLFPHRAVLAKLFGDKAYHFLIRVHLGLGRTRIQPAEDYERKSVGTESTFRDMSSHSDLREKLRHIAEELEGDLKRTQFKGRTLVLKAKLHTYEVITRQMAPPMAVSKADELFKYGLPMLEKLWKEIPGMRLRLMGLRCTHLVSTQKPDFDGFFGMAKTTTQSPTKGANPTEEGWEEWPDRETGGDSANRFIPCHPNELVEQEETGDKGNKDTWLCPICAHPQPSSRGNDAFNAHIDFCLSRQTIAEAVQETSETPPSRSEVREQAIGVSEMNLKKPQYSSSNKKRGRPPRDSNERFADAARGTKRLFFA